jgi:acetyltransferase-like isoleucine patch superfamily enzyme
MSKLLARIMWHVVPHRLISWVHIRWLVWLDFLPALLTQVPSHPLRVAAYRRLGARIGAHTSLHRGCQFQNLPGLQIGPHTVINGGVVLDARCGLSIGANVSISAGAMLYSQQHDLDDPDFRLEGAPITVADYVFIGPRSIVLPGVRIGEGAAVAAGAVVTADVLPYTVVGGVPARPLRERRRDLRYTLDYRRAGY